MYGRQEASELTDLSLSRTEEISVLYGREVRKYLEPIIDKVRCSDIGAYLSLTCSFAAEVHRLG